MQVKINITLQLHRASAIHWASFGDLNETAVPQSIDLQKMKEPKQLQLTQPEGLGNFVGWSNLIGQEWCDV